MHFTEITHEILTGKQDAQLHRIDFAVRQRQEKLARLKVQADKKKIATKARRMRKTSGN